MKKESSNYEVELWNKSLLAFVLGVHNNQMLTANAFIKKYDKLRNILTKLYLIFE